MNILSSILLLAAELSVEEPELCPLPPPCLAMSGADRVLKLVLMLLVLPLTSVFNTASLEFNVYNIYDGFVGPKVGIEISNSILSQISI